MGRKFSHSSSASFSVAVAAVLVWLLVVSQQQIERARSQQANRKKKKITPAANQSVDQPRKRKVGIHLLFVCLLVRPSVRQVYLWPPCACARVRDAPEHRHWPGIGLTSEAKGCAAASRQKCINPAPRGPQLRPALLELILLLLLSAAITEEQ